MFSSHIKQTETTITSASQTTHTVDNKTPELCFSWELPTSEATVFLEASF